MRLPLAIALLALVPAAVGAQDSTVGDSAPRDTTVRDTASREASAPEPAARTPAKVIVRYGFDDGAVEIDVRPGGYISIAGAQGDSAATVTVRGSDARAWTDSTSRIFRRAAPRKRTVVVLQRSIIAEAADSGAAVSFIRRAETDSTSFQLFFANRSRGGFPLALERREAELFLAAMRRAVAVALPRAAKQQPKPKPTPKPKPAPPVADSTR